MRFASARDEKARFFRFALVGAVGAVIDFGIFNLLSGVFHVSAVVSSVISFITAVCSNFLWNRYWTYPDSRTKHVAHQLVQFVVISLIGLAIRTPLFAYLEKTLVNLMTSHPLPLPFTPTFLGHNSALASAILVVMLWNYFANRYWTYADIDRASE
jgi:putative flippase GtrA